eukprot:gnl/MRDRNA2_/MRDRNA2_27531_c0_seq1.p1 gnl/MRDRNA2_/MRDRNA2_27531_c0~~gnl/MRDRNA2_/MRDRNA2_27531_c0_seq1.p1  ORF type:complete len:574 (+),score=101.11 gnl/MRDRNA2_/MRDRNA2_27531_c0_seq1:100-1821(+)
MHCDRVASPSRKHQSNHGQTKANMSSGKSPKQPAEIISKWVNTQKISSSGISSEIRNTLWQVGINKAWDLVESFQARGIMPDTSTLSFLLTKSSERYSKSSGRFSPLGREHMYRTIYLVEQSLLTNPKDVDDPLFSALFDLCCSLKDIEYMEKLFELMQALRVPPSTWTLGLLVKGYGQAGNMQKVSQIWDEILQNGEKASPVTIACMLNACVDCGNLQKAAEVFAELKARQEHRDIIFYTILIKGYGYVKDLSSAMSLFKEMHDEQLPCNTFAYNTFISTCVKSGELQAAQYLVVNMLDGSTAGAPEPDIITFSILLKAYCKAGLLDKAKHIFDVVKQQQIQCDARIYNIMLEGYAKANCSEECVHLFQEMVLSGVQGRATAKCKEITHTILVRLFARAGYFYGSGWTAVAKLYQQLGVEPPRLISADWRSPQETHPYSDEFDPSAFYNNSWTDGDAQVKCLEESFGTDFWDVSGDWMLYNFQQTEFDAGMCEMNVSYSDFEHAPIQSLNPHAEEFVPLEQCLSTDAKELVPTCIQNCRAVAAELLDNESISDLLHMAVSIPIPDSDGEDSD